MRVSRGQCVVTKAVAALDKIAFKKASPIIMNGQILHSITDERLELVRSMEKHMTDQVRGSPCLVIHSPRPTPLTEGGRKQRAARRVYLPDVLRRRCRRVFPGPAAAQASG